MPLELGAVNAINAVLFVPNAIPWRERAATWLMGLDGASSPAIDAWLDLLERRAAGTHDWAVQLAGRTFPDGRPTPPVRLYNDALERGTATDAIVRTWSCGPLPFALDVWGPGARGGEPDALGLELLVHRKALQPVDGAGMEAVAERRAALGDAFAATMAEACEVFEPVYALADGMQPVSDFLGGATADRVRHAAPTGSRLADYAWALTYWSPERLDDRLRARLAELDATPPGSRVDEPGSRPTVRALATGGLFLVARRVLGAEHRRSRAQLETPLATRLGLRSNHLIYRR